MVLDLALNLLSPTRVNLVGVAVATLLRHFLGWFWYSAFADPWCRAVHKKSASQFRAELAAKKEVHSHSSYMYLTAFLGSLTQAYIFAVFHSLIPDLRTSYAASALGAVLGSIGFNVANAATHYAFEERTIGHFVINCGYDVVGTVLSALAIQYFQQVEPISL